LEDHQIMLNKIIVPAAIALGLALTPALAAETHSHHGAAATVKLRLDHGKKWPTDDVLRRGMSEIRSEIAQALTPIHKGAFTPAQYDALAGRIQAQIDNVVGNCKLPEAADQQLHVVLEQIIDGVAGMKASAARDKGAVKIVQALGQYGNFFDHAGWQPLDH
jgi:hypothetical protein